MCSGTCGGDAIKIYGDSASVQNDWHKLSRISINGGFNYGIEIIGRTIWSVFENIQVSYAQSNGIQINIPSTASFNFNVFRDSKANNNGGSGIYFASANTSAPPESNTWDRVDVENNAAHGSSPCAGFVANGIGGGNTIAGSYFESNCSGSSDSHAAHVRFTGTYNEGWTLIGNLFSNVTGQWAIYNDTNWTGGVYTGNVITGAGNSIYIATSNSGSSLLLGNNVLLGVSAPQIVPDANSVSHVTMISSSGPRNAITGTRFVCIDKYGNLVSQTTPCSGT